MAEPCRDLPETGRLSGRGGEANLEVVLRTAPGRTRASMHMVCSSNAGSPACGAGLGACAAPK